MWTEELLGLMFISKANNIRRQNQANRAEPVDSEDDLLSVPGIDYEEVVTRGN